MKNTIIYLSVILTLSLLSGCNLILNSFKHKDNTQEFFNNIINEDYKKAQEYMDIDAFATEGIDSDSLNFLLMGFRDGIVRNFGANLTYTFLKSTKNVSTHESENVQQGTTIAWLEIRNEKECGTLKFTILDKSNKIIRVDLGNTKYPIQFDASMFWLLGILIISVPIINIYAIVKISRSNLKNKWIKYISVICLNVPVITCSAIKGFSLTYKFQLLMGISFSLGGYISSYWSFGIPIGGLFWIWRLWVRSKLMKEGIDLDKKESLTEEN